jgi:hypothetical protein
MTGNAATTPPLGEILTADEIAQFVYSTSPVVLVDVEPALAARRGPTVIGGVRWVCRIWRGRCARLCRRQPAAARRSP